MTIAEDMVVQTYNPSRGAEMEGLGRGSQPGVTASNNKKTKQNKWQGAPLLSSLSDFGLLR